MSKDGSLFTDAVEGMFEYDFNRNSSKNEPCAHAVAVVIGMIISEDISQRVSGFIIQDRIGHGNGS